MRSSTSFRFDTAQVMLHVLFCAAGLAMPIAGVVGGGSAWHLVFAAITALGAAWSRRRAHSMGAEPSPAATIALAWVAVWIAAVLVLVAVSTLIMADFG